MQRAVLYILSFVCALAVNIVLVGLLFFPAPKKLPLKYQPQTITSFTLSSNTIEQDIKKEIPEIIDTYEHKNIESAFVTTVPLSLEAELFFHQGQKILAEFNIPSATPIKPKQNGLPSELPELNQAHCYCTSTMKHINIFQTSLRKKYKKLLQSSLEQPSQKPDITIRIAKDGSLKNILLKKSSGSKLYDKLYVQAIKQAAPMPRIPNHFNVQEVEFEL